MDPLINLLRKIGGSLSENITVGKAESSDTQKSGGSNPNRSLLFSD